VKINMERKEEVFRKIMNQGHSAAWDQEWELAVGFYSQALEQIPDQPRALTSLGLALFELGSFEKALEYYQRAAEVSPDDPLPVEKAAEILERIGRLDRAAERSMLAADLYLKARDIEKSIENWTRVVRLFPENLTAHSRLALVHERMGNIQQAITEYLAVASLMQYTNRIDDALKTTNHARRLDPENKEAQRAWGLLKDNRKLPKPMRQRGGTGPLRMARVLQMEGLKDDSQDGKAIESPDPITESRQVALTKLASMLFEFSDATDETQAEGRGLVSIARGIASEITSRGPDYEEISVHLGQSVDLQTRGENKKAAEELEHAIDAGLDHPAAYFNLGLLFFETGRKESAQRYLQRAVKHPDFILPARLLIGEFQIEKNRLNNAVEEFLEALKYADTQIVPLENSDELGQLYEPLIEALSQEDDVTKLQNLCANIKDLILRPNWRVHLKNAREQLPAENDGTPPVPLASLLTEAKSSQVVGALARINQHSSNGYFRTAIEESYGLLQYAPTYLPLHVIIGDLLLHQDKVQEAIDKFTIIAKAYDARGESTRASDLLQKIVEISPMDLEARTRLIGQLTARGDIEKALSEYMNLADVYYRLAQLDRARATYENALRLAQQSKVNRVWGVKILHHMADIDLQRLDWRQAVRVFEQLRTHEPEDEKARMSLIDLSVRLGQEGKARAELENYVSYLNGQAKEYQAISFVESLVSENPNLLFAHYMLARLYQQTKRIEDAVKQWDRAGELLYASGDKEGAIEAIRSILMLNPPNSEHYQRFLAYLES
jgi:tetratricopeptide (TPR) repeat protein